jgi:hypothetical protein
MFIIVMRNAFATQNKVHITYDLKGSEVGRSTDPAEKEKCIAKGTVTLSVVIVLFSVNACRHSIERYGFRSQCENHEK